MPTLSDRLSLWLCLLHCFPTVFAGLLAFGVVALLYLVTQELLTEASENLEGKDVVYPNMCLFLGLAIVIATERMTT